MNVTTTDDLGPEHAAELCDLYDQYPWWERRTVDDIQTMIKHTDLLVGLRDAETGDLIAAGRVITDFVYYGKVFDVIVAEGHRNNGLGRTLMESIIEHPALDSLSILTLDCREGLIPFYEDCGFERHEKEFTLEGRTEELVSMAFIQGNQ